MTTALVIIVVVVMTAVAGYGDAELLGATSSRPAPLDLLPPAVIMPWFCTQRCGFNVSQIIQHVDQAEHLATHDVPILNTVAFERYNLGPNSTLLLNPDLFDINKYILKNATLAATFPRRIAMVSSYPYPPQFLDWMRQLFDNPEPFVSAVVGDIVRHNIAGLNIDFEPSSGNATNEDATRYAVFLNVLRERLEAQGKVLTVAGATWTPIWNLTLIAQALSGSEGSGNVNNTIGYFTSMNTYTYANTSFERELSINIQEFGTYGSLKSLIVGLETWPSQFTPAELKFHFDLLAQHGVCRIAIWDMPLTPAMVPHLANFSQRCAH
jgi:hypothetical protein